MGRRGKPEQKAESHRAVGYVRVSTEDQAREGVSLEAQRARIVAWAESNGYELLAVHQDAGISGKQANGRPGLAAALEAVREARGALVTYSLSRISRSTRDMLAIAEQLEDVGADLVSLTERIDTTGAAGRMVFRLLAVLNEFERDLVSERTSSSLRHKAAAGQHVGRPPRGAWIEGKRLVADGDGLKLFRRACELRDSGLTYAQAGAALEAEGFAPIHGRRFWGSTVHALVSNRNLARLAGAAA